MLIRNFLAMLVAVCATGCVASVDESDFFYRDGEERRKPVPEGFTITQIAYDCGSVSVGLTDLAGSDGLLLYFGGNQFRMGENAADVAEAAGNAGFAKLITFDYPGRGATTGDIVAGCYIAAARAAAGHARSAFADSEITAHGFSFGGLMASYGATAGDIDALILESTARSPETWLRAMAPAGARIEIPSSMAGIDTVDALNGLEAPILVVTGSADRSAGPAAARELARALEASGRDVTLVIAPGATHGTAFEHADARQALEELQRRIR